MQFYEIKAANVSQRTINTDADSIRLPDNIEYIANDAFDSDVQLGVKEGSATAAYCDSHGIAYFPVP